MTAVQMESEATVYAKVLNFDGLKQASRVEKHLQIEASYTKKGCRSRVRKTTLEDGTVTIVHTLKTPEETSAGISKNKEKNITVDEEYLEMFIKVAEKSLVKTRYSFVFRDFPLKVMVDGKRVEIKVPEIIYEVDIFERKDGETSQFCKIDIELDDIYSFIRRNFPDARVTEVILKVSHLPINPADPILGKDPDPAKQKILSDIWENEFNRRY